MMLNALILLLGIIILVASLGLGIMLPVARTAAEASGRSPRNVTPPPVRGRHVIGGILGSVVGAVLVVVGLAAPFVEVPAGNVGVVMNFGQVQAAVTTASTVRIPALFTVPEMVIEISFSRIGAITPPARFPALGQPIRRQSGGSSPATAGRPSLLPPAWRRSWLRAEKTSRTATRRSSSSRGAASGISRRSAAVASRTSRSVRRPCLSLLRFL